MSERFVAKGGGTTGADSTAIMQGVYGRMIDGELTPAAIIPSAPGKTKDAKKLTDYAIACIGAGAKSDNKKLDENFEPIRERFREIADGLGLLWAPYRDLIGVYYGALQEGYGHAGVPEQIMGHILADAVPNGVYIKPTEVIDVDTNGNVALSSSKKAGRVLRKLPKNAVPVIGGFVGEGVDGVGVTTRRGGSDTTGAHIARALKMPYVIYTDTPGIMSVDTSKISGISNPITHGELEFSEVREAAIIGNTYVVNAAALDPIEQMNGIIIVKDYRDSNAAGTVIARGDRTLRPGELGSIITGKPYRLIRIVKHNSDPEVGFNRAVADAFAAHRVPVHQHYDETNAISVTTDRDENNTQRETAIRKALNDVERHLKPVKIEVDSHGCQSGISIIGAGLRNRGGVLQERVGEVLKDLRIKANPFSFSGINYSVLVPDEKFEETVRKLHEAVIVG